MLPTGVNAGNTGRVHVGAGFQPVATVGHPAAGEILIQSSVIDEPYGNYPLPEKYKKQIWAIASADDQEIIYDEEVNENE